MHKNEVAKQVGISPRHFAYLLRGERNLSIEGAKKIVNLLGGPILCWIDPDQVATRRQVWADFLARSKEAQP